MAAGYPWRVVMLMDLYQIADLCQVESFRVRSVQLEAAVAISVMALGTEDDVKRLMGEFGISSKPPAEEQSEEWAESQRKMASVFAQLQGKGKK